MSGIYTVNFCLDEMDQIICSLERGTVITKFYPRRKPEKRTLMLRRETRQVLPYLENQLFI